MDEETSRIDIMQINQLKKLLSEFGESAKFEHDLKKKNWFNIGGKSKVFFKADNLKNLINLLKSFCFTCVVSEIGSIRKVLDSLGRS